MMPFARGSIRPSTFRSKSGSKLNSEPPPARSLASASRSTSKSKAGSSLASIPEPSARRHLTKPDTAPANSSRSDVPITRHSVNEAPANAWCLPRQKCTISPLNEEADAKIEAKTERDTRRSEADIVAILNEAPWPKTSVQSDAHEFILSRPYTHYLDDVEGTGILACVNCRAGLFDMSLKCKLKGGFTGFRVGHAGNLTVQIRCTNDYTKLLAQCRRCGTIAGELVGDDDGLALRCQLSSLHFVPISEPLPECFHSSFDDLDTSDSPGAPLEKPAKIAGHERKGKVAGMRAESRLLEYDHDEATDEDEEVGTPSFERKLRPYNVEFFSDSDSSESDYV